ncbi:MAG: hypothetical protein ACKVOB_08820 [Sphingomonas sp.]
MGDKHDRAARLAAALRENLKKRKDRARGSVASELASAPGITTAADKPDG